MIKKLQLELLAIDGGTQQRDIDEATVAKYAALMREGSKFPPAAVVFDGTRYWLWDGFHRYHAAKRAGLKDIECNIENATLRDAIWFSFHANHDHGLPRQDGTGKKIILRILADPQWAKMSQGEIAQWVGVTQAYVSKVKIEKEQADKPKPPKAAPKEAKKAASNKEGPPAGDGESEPATEDLKPLADTVGQPVPEKLREVFARANELKLLVHQITTVASAVKAAKARNDQLFYYINAQNVEVEAGNLKRSIKAGLPHAVCVYCGGDGGSCRTCDGTGYVNELRYKASAQELKK